MCVTLEWSLTVEIRYVFALPLIYCSSSAHINTIWGTCSCHVNHPDLVMHICVKLSIKSTEIFCQENIGENVISKTLVIFGQASICVKTSLLPLYNQSRPSLLTHICVTYLWIITAFLKVPNNMNTGHSLLRVAVKSGKNTVENVDNRCIMQTIETIRCPGDHRT